MVFLTSIWKKAGGMPTANRGRRLRRLSPVTFYAALSELPRGADERQDAPEEASRLPSWSPREPGPPSPCMPRNGPIKWDVMSARFEGLGAAFVEDHLVTDVVIAPLI
jgi:hypothetical protein